jgi:hypothetical protein
VVDLNSIVAIHKIPNVSEMDPNNIWNWQNWGIKIILANSSLELFYCMEDNIEQNRIDYVASLKEFKEISEYLINLK